MTHGPSCRWASRGEESIDQSTQETDRVPAGLPCAAQNKYLDGAKLPQGNIQFKVLKESADGRMQIAFDLRVAQAGHGQGSHLWQIDLPVPVHRHAGIKVDLPPGPYQQLIPWSQHIICWHRN